VGTIDGQVHAALTAVFIRVVLDRGPHCRVIDHRQQFGQMLGEHLEIQHLIAVVHLFEQQVTGQITRQTLQLLPQALRLTLQRQDRRRKPAGQTQGASLPGIESGPAVEAWGGQHLGNVRG
jgi:hypothetical protein